MSDLVVDVQSFDYPKEQQDKTAGLENIQFEVQPGEVVCLVGKNGSCKTTLAKILCGQLTAADGVKGDVTLGTARLADGRHVGYLAQDYPLLPWLTVEENLQFPLRMYAKGKRFPGWVHDFLGSSDVKDHLKKYPAQLSGGQRQQVALIQALVLDPGLLIMDEPYSALSQIAATNVKELVKELQRRGKIVAQVVHDFGDIIDTSTRILVMNATRDRRYTIIADLPLESETREKSLLRDQFANDIATLAFQEAMIPLDQEEVQERESTFPPDSEVVIVALDPEREYKHDRGFSFLPVIAKNLKRRVKYTYVFPGFTEAVADGRTFQGAGSSIDAFVGELMTASAFNRENLGKLLTIYVVAPKAFRYADFVVATHEGSPIGGWEFPTAHPRIIFETDSSKLEQKLQTVREVFQDKGMARQVFP